MQHRTRPQKIREEQTKDVEKLNINFNLMWPLNMIDDVPAATSISESDGDDDDDDDLSVESSATPACCDHLEGDLPQAKPPPQLSA